MKYIKQIFITLLSAVLISSLFSGCMSEIEQSLNNIFFDEETAEPITVPVSETENREIEFFGFNNLSSEKIKTLYNAIKSVADSIEPQTAECSVSATEKEISEAYTAYVNDHPEAFWLTNNFKYYNENVGTTTITPIYNTSGKNLEKAKNRFDLKIEEIISKSPKEPSEYDAELFANDYLINNCTYDNESVDSGNYAVHTNDAYGALVEGKAVCEGYARAFQLLCNKLNVNCINVTGTAETAHQWNCVLIDGSWYNVDVTWNDTDSEDEYLNNTYLNVTDEEFSNRHTTSPLYSEISEAEYESSSGSFNVFVPTCTNDKYNYKKLTYAPLDNLDEADAVVSMLAANAKAGKSYLNVQVSDSLDFDETVEKVTTQNYIYNWYERANRINQNVPKIICNRSIYILRDENVFTLTIDYE